LRLSYQYFLSRF